MVSSRHIRNVNLVLALLVTAGLSGCASGRYVRLRDEPYSPLMERFKISVSSDGRSGPRTYQLLNAHTFSVPRHPEAQLEIAQGIHQRSPTIESTAALAELNFIVGRRREYHDPHSAMEYYFDSMAAAYGYLFHSRFGPTRNPNDPAFRGIKELYNGSLERMLRIADSLGRFCPGATLRLPISGRSIHFVVTSGSSNWEPRHFGRFRFVSDYDVEGLTRLHRADGLGVPLIAVRKPKTDHPAVEKYYAEDLTFPITAFVRFNETPVSSQCGRTCQLELHNPFETSVVSVHDVVVPLRTDITTPLAWFLDRPRFRYLDTYGLIRSDRVAEYQGLYMMQPYQPDKIPVLFVHGLWSSPMTWMPMLNDLMARPEIRERYQFWFYLYPTGQPFWHAAGDLRKDLNHLRGVFDPARRHAPMDNMVVIGHSMGGLMARMLTEDSGDRFWNSVSRVPLNQTPISAEHRARLRQIYYFRPHPSVSRVVTIATPFRGSGYSNRVTRWFAKNVISLPTRTLNTMSALFRVQGDSLRLGQPTSFDGLHPDSPILRAIECSPRRPGVAFHNIVAVKDHRARQATDGVVDFPSAHRDDVLSELLVESGHSEVQQSPYTVSEVFRILMRHLYESGTVMPLQEALQEPVAPIEPPPFDPPPTPTREAALPQRAGRSRIELSPPIQPATASPRSRRSDLDSGRVRYSSSGL